MNYKIYEMDFDHLKLSNQICFPIYAASRLVIREYKPYLDKLGITYPQYLVLLVLWEDEGISVNEINRKLILNTNTVTPLLKRMESMGLVLRNRSDSDERKVILQLTEKGRSLKFDAACIPGELIEKINSETMKLDDLLILREKLNKFIDVLIDR